MKNECNIIRDILPLYVENMVSDETADFVKEHLDKCPECSVEFKKMKSTTAFDKINSNSDIPYNDTAPLKAFKKEWSRRKFITIGVTALTVLLVFIASYFIGSGFSKRTDVVLVDYSVSEDGSKITLNTAIPTSMGYIRCYKNNGGGVKPHYLTFYSTFGGLNSSFGAKHEFELDIDEGDTEIYFSRAGGGYELILQKNSETGEWITP